MSEAYDAERRRILGGFAAAFLMTGGYSQVAVQKMGDLSDISPQRVHELLAAKVEERKRALEWAKTRRIQVGIEAQKKLKRARKK
jgi:ribosomal protein L32E